MNESSFWIVVIALVFGALTVVSGLGLIRLREGRDVPRKQTSDELYDQHQPPTVFLFKGRELRDATKPARQLPGLGGFPGSEWQQLQAWIDKHCPQAAGIMSAATESVRSEQTAYIDPLGEEFRLLVERPGKDLTRVTLTPTNPDRPGDGKILPRRALEEELALLRDAFDNAPTLVWRKDSSGRITWANAAYLSQVSKITGDDPTGEMLPHLLDLPDSDTEFSRAKLISGDETLWFDCQRRNVGRETLFFAVPADAAVRAERFLREFVQTLTRTFATLNTGFAIFDRQRNLQLFNPAIIDLTGLSAEFLATRPTLADFLDRLRELRMMPEPKDYPTWRRQINNLESAAASGHHLEEWSLPGGRVFRVQGSPHPDGAIAFLFEDITSEMAIRREYREELALNKAVLDQIDDALAVFGPNGKLVLCNKSYREGWAGDAPTAHDAIYHWHSLMQAGSDFDALCQCLISGDIEGNRSSGQAVVSSGQQIRWQIWQISGDCRMVCFHPVRK